MRKQAKEELIKYLSKHKRDVEYEIRKNKREMRDLVERQTVLKRERAEIDKAIKSVDA